MVCVVMGWLKGKWWVGDGGTVDDNNIRIFADRFDVVVIVVIGGRGGWSTRIDSHSY